MRFATNIPVPERSVSYEPLRAKGLTMISVAEPDLVTAGLSAAVLEIHRQDYLERIPSDDPAKGVYDGAVNRSFDPGDPKIVKRYERKLKQQLRQPGAQLWMGFESDNNAAGKLDIADSPVSAICIEPVKRRRLTTPVFGKNDLLMHPLLMIPVSDTTRRRVIMASALQTVITDAGFADDSRLKAELVSKTAWHDFILSTLHLTVLHRSNRGYQEQQFGAVRTAFTTFDNRPLLQVMKGYLENDFTWLGNKRLNQVDSLPLAVTTSNSQPDNQQTTK